MRIYIRFILARGKRTYGEACADSSVSFQACVSGAALHSSCSVTVELSSLWVTTNTQLTCHLFNPSQLWYAQTSKFSFIILNTNFIAITVTGSRATHNPLVTSSTHPIRLWYAQSAHTSKFPFFLFVLNTNFIVFIAITITGMCSNAKKIQRKRTGRMQSYQDSRTHWQHSPSLPSRSCPPSY
jgi:hypothetical protein